jgi:hypothetical protein
MKKLTATIIGIILVGAIANGCSSNKEYPSPCPEGQYVSGLDEKCYEYKDISWIPSGFSGNDNIAWQWKDSRWNGTAQKIEWDYEVETRNGCPNGIRAEVAIFNKDDYQIDYDTEWTTSVAPGQKVLLTFSTRNENAYSSDISEINCR